MWAYNMCKSINQRRPSPRPKIYMLIITNPTAIPNVFNRSYLRLYDVIKTISTFSTFFSVVFYKPYNNYKQSSTKANNINLNSLQLKWAGTADKKELRAPVGMIRVGHHIAVSSVLLKMPS